MSAIAAYLVDGQLIGGLPEHARHASGLARELDVLRVTCQRVVSALSSEAGAPTALAKLPGPEGLRQFVGAFKKTDVNPAHIEAADAAVSALERLITVTGGSQTKLNERLSVSPGGQGAGDEDRTVVASHGVGSFPQRVPRGTP